ncbi:MAG: methyltransferase domain-containing protein [Saprospiraceae bacterium]|nr:methyltransferase domain-containing protein [Saprospiraceae bacterium]
MEESLYIHGSDPIEQDRLSRLNDWLNQSCLAALNLDSRVHRVLDVGSGLGQFTRAMAGVLPDDAFVLGIERDARQLEKARNLAAGDPATQKLEFRQGLAEQLPLSDPEWGSFDLAHTRFVLEHVRRPEVVVRQMAAAVKPGGSVVLLDDDHANFRLWPEPPGFAILWEAYLRSYERLGNDPLVGRRLVSLLQQQGLVHIEPKLIFFGGSAGQSIFPVVAENILGILMGSREWMVSEGLITAGLFEDCIRLLDDWRKLPDATLWYGLNYAEGRKPQ